VRVLLQAFIQPIGLSAILVLAGAVSGRPAISLAGLALLWLLGTPVVSDAILGPLERGFPALDVAECSPADAVVIVSGNVLNGVNRVGVQWGPSANRFHDGVRLVLAQRAPLLIVAGAAPQHHGQVSQGEILRDAAVARGVRREQVLITGPVSTTADEARAVGALCRSRGIRSIIVVTSAWHMPRAMRLFRQTGLAVAAFPTDQRVHAHARFAIARLLPRARTLANSDAAIHEYWGLLWAILTSTPDARRAPPHAPAGNPRT
jgi:uncharacterized SAM-binding protein YcdF (DUF218 family)